MTRHRQPKDPRRRRSARVWWVVAGISIALALVAAIGLSLGVFGDGAGEEAHVSQDDAALQRCKSETVGRLMSPSTVKLTGVAAATSELDPDSKDLFSLLDDPLKGVDHSRINVWNVVGVAESQNAYGDAMQTPFECRAYFVDGNLAHTLVLLDHHH